MRALLGERGEISLVQMLVAMSLFAGILGATLTTFDDFTRLDNRNVERSAAQDSARTSVDRLARDLRNLASPTPEQPQAVDRATPYDLVFQTVDPIGPNSGANSANVKRVRWCLDSSNAANGKLYVEQQTWTTLDTPTMPATLACPGTGWPSVNVLAQNITNRINGNDRSLFTFNSTTLTAVNKVHVDLYANADPIHAANETHLVSGVFLRNQNAVPVAGTFTYVPVGNNAIVLNGSAAYDPEGQPLDYVWVDNGNKVGDGITYTYAVAPGSTHSIQLKVFDPAHLEGDSQAQTITMGS